jgi:ABC-2 type transport system ATP-binding protein
MLLAKNLTKNYGDFNALNDLNMQVKPGEIYCILGGNGAGKSTTINLFLGFISPTSGYVEVKGLNVATNSLETKQYIGYIPENLMLYPNLSGLENLEFFAGLVKKKYAKKDLINFLVESGLQEEAFTKKVSQYSKGMRQKVGIAITLAKGAKALLLDEPTSGLDPKASNEFSKLLLKLKEQGVATLMATHDIFRAKQIATHIGIMKQGVLVKTCNSKELNMHELENFYLETIA